MATISEPLLAVGARHAVVFALNSSGTPAATDKNAYSGLEVEGPKAFALNVPEPRKFTHVGNDRPLAIDYLPPTEAMDGELRVSLENFDVIALLGDVTKFTIGEATAVGLATSSQGFEPQVGMMFYQQAIGLTSGARRWRAFIFPSARAVYMPSGMSDNTEDVRYKVAPAICKKHIWGTALADSDEGITSAQGFQVLTEGIPNLVAFSGDSTEVAYTFPASKQAKTTAKISVWVNDVLTTAGITKAVSGITFDVAPTGGDRIVVFYEY